MEPLSYGIPDADPATLPRVIPLPATRIQVITDDKALEQGLLAGLIALHVDGYDSALLLDSPRASKPEDKFGQDLHVNVALVRRTVSDVAMRAVKVPARQQGENAVLYLEGIADRRDPGHDRDERHDLWNQPAAGLRNGHHRDLSAYTADRADVGSDCHGDRRSLSAAARPRLDGNGLYLAGGHRAAAGPGRQPAVGSVPLVGGLLPHTSYFAEVVYLLIVSQYLTSPQDLVHWFSRST